MLSSLEECRGLKPMRRYLLSNRGHRIKFKKNNEFWKSPSSVNVKNEIHWGEVISDKCLALYLVPSRCSRNIYWKKTNKGIKVYKFPVIKNGHGDVKYSVGSSVNNTVINYVWWALGLLGWSFPRLYKCLIIVVHLKRIQYCMSTVT